MSWTRNAKPEGSRSRVVCALDVGSSKICCLIARLTPRPDGGLLAGRENQIDVIGFGHVRSAGIKSGRVSDLDAAEAAIRTAIDAAEFRAGVTVDSVYLAVTAGRIGSDTFSSSIELDGGEVSRSDIRAVLSAGRDHADKPDRSALHALAIGYTLDGEHGIEDPVGMSGSTLGVDMHVVSADSGPLGNLEAAINRSHLAVDTAVATPFASGLATLTQDEVQLGAACIDMGAGTTSIAIFLGGRLVFADAIAVGGQHVSLDMARGLSVAPMEAERLKVLHACANPNAASHGQFVSIPALAHLSDRSGGHQNQVSTAEIARIVTPRIEETLELVRDRVTRSGFGGVVGKRIVLTGGASQLSNMGDAASRIFNADVRMGRPLGVSGLPQQARSAAFSTAAGLLVYPQHARHDLAQNEDGLRATLSAIGLTRMGAWLKASL